MLAKACTATALAQPEIPSHPPHLGASREKGEVSDAKGFAECRSRTELTNSNAIRAPPGKAGDQGNRSKHKKEK
jgi:hypothetical protein